MHMKQARWTKHGAAENYKRTTEKSHMPKACPVVGEGDGIESEGETLQKKEYHTCMFGGARLIKTARVWLEA